MGFCRLMAGSVNAWMSFFCICMPKQTNKHTNRKKKKMPASFPVDWLWLAFGIPVIHSLKRQLFHGWMDSSFFLIYLYFLLFHPQFFLLLFFAGRFISFSFVDYFTILFRRLFSLLFSFPFTFNDVVVFVIVGCAFVCCHFQGSLNFCANGDAQERDGVPPTRRQPPPSDAEQLPSPTTPPHHPKGRRR